MSNNGLVYVPQMVMKKGKGKSIHEPPTVGRRAGFAVKLHGDHCRMLHITSVWRASHGPLSADAIRLVAEAIPAYDKCDFRGWRTIRIRAKDIEPMIELLLAASAMPFNGAFTLSKRAKSLKGIDANELLADAAR